MALRGWAGVGRGRQVAIATVLVGPSGSAKSTAIREVMRLDQEVQSLYFGNSYKEWLHDRWLPCEGTMPGVLETLSDMHLETFDAPLYQYALGTTPAILYSEELPVSFLTKPESLKLMLELLDPLPKVDRRLAKYRAMTQQGQKAPACVVRPAISTVFATTPAALTEALRGHHIDGGLAMRVIWAFARGDIKRLTIDAPDRSDQRQEVARYWVEALKWHDAMAFRGESGERLLPLTPQVKVLLELIRAQAEDAHDRLDDRTVAVKVRGLNHAQYIAQIFAWSRGDDEVHPDDLDRAMNFVQMAHESFNEIAGLVGNPDWLRQERLRRAIEQSKGLSKKECYRLLNCSKRELDEALEALKERGIIDHVKVATGGRPSDRYLPKRAASDERGVVLPFKKPDSDDSE